MYNNFCCLAGFWTIHLQLTVMSWWMCYARPNRCFETWVFLCIRSSLLDFISKIIQDHYFIWQLSVVTSCQLVYRIDVAHPTDGRHASSNSGKKQQTVFFQCQTKDWPVLWRITRSTIGSVLLSLHKADKKRFRVSQLTVRWFSLLTLVKGSWHSWVWSLASSYSLPEVCWKDGAGLQLHDLELTLFNPAIRRAPFLLWK